MAQSKLAKCDIALPSYSAGGSTRREGGRVGAFETPFWGREVEYRWYHYKERW